MHWLQTLDAGLFHWVNPTLSNSILDGLMTFASGNPFFPPAFVLACALLVWKGGARGRICVLMLVMVIALGDSFVCNTLKHLIHRPRPFRVIPDVHVPQGIGLTDSGSMPSSHAANWFAATMVLLIYYRRSVWYMLPLAVIVSFSRIYNGVHYPGDVLAGAILGAGYAAGMVWTLDALWRWAGQRWYPLWWQRLPSLLDPAPGPTIPHSALLGAPKLPSEGGRTPHLIDKQWLRLGYALIVIELAVNLAYIASGKISLSEDEAYRWMWSKHLALSYYSKPPLIAYTQFLGTSLWGDTVFGVRFFAPVISAIISLLLLRFMAQVVNARAAFWLSVIVPTVPLLALGSVFMDTDPLSVMFWTLAMIAGWRAAQDNSITRDWLWVGLWMGLGFLSKYTNLAQLVSWAVFFALWPPARRQLRRPGPYLALLVTLICTIPVVVWNYQRGWVTVHSVAQTGNLDMPESKMLSIFAIPNLWHAFLKYAPEFVGEEVGLQNPFFFLPVAWAAIVFWKRKRDNPLLVYFFSMGAPLFVGYFLLTFHTRCNPNWIAPSILPLFCLGVVYWDEQWRAGFKAIKNWLYSGLVIGCFAVVILHDFNLIPKLTGYRLPTVADPWRRVNGWAETAQVVEAAREKLLAEGKPVFIIGEHYGITSQVAFNLPEAKMAVADHPFVFYMSSLKPENQYYYWPGYRNQDHKGQNAIFVNDLDFKRTQSKKECERLKEQFESINDLGTVLVKHDGQPMRMLEIIECRGLR